MQNDTNQKKYVWIFNGNRSSFPSGIFTCIEDAENWIRRHTLSGVLTRYPVDEGSYDYAIATGLFTVKKPEHETPEFIGKFSCAGFEHYHYEDGKR